MLNMKNMKKTSMFVFGLFLMGLGIALATKSNLGTSPITSVPYVLSMIFPITIGQFTLIINLLFLVIQIIILGKDFHRKQYLQAIVCFIFGAFVDLGMFILNFVNPTLYVAKITTLIIGCIVLALGIYIQVRADVIMNPGEALVIAIAKKMGKEFGLVKITFDFTLILIGVIISLFALEAVKGIREGTIISAFLIGYLIRLINIIVRNIDKAKLKNKKQLVS